MADRGTSSQIHQHSSAFPFVSMPLSSLLLAVFFVFQSGIIRFLGRAFNVFRSSYQHNVQLSSFWGRGDVCQLGHDDENPKVRPGYHVAFSTVEIRCYDVIEFTLRNSWKKWNRRTLDWTYCSHTPVDIEMVERRKVAAGHAILRSNSSTRDTRKMNVPKRRTSLQQLYDANRYFDQSFSNAQASVSSESCFRKQQYYQ